MLIICVISLACFACAMLAAVAENVPRLSQRQEDAGQNYEQAD